MAKQTIRTMSEATANALPDVIRRVQEDGGSAANTPYVESDGRPAWFKADSKATVSGAVVYTGKLYSAPNATTPISAVAVKARNANDLGSGGAVDAPIGVPFFRLCRLKIGTEWFHLFSFGGGSSGAVFMRATAYQQAVVQNVTPAPAAVYTLTFGGKGVNDVFYAVPVLSTGSGPVYIEVPYLPKSNTIGHILQTLDSDGRIGHGPVRALA